MSPNQAVRSGEGVGQQSGSQSGSCSTRNAMEEVLSERPEVKSVQKDPQGSVKFQSMGYNEVERMKELDQRVWATKVILEW